MRYCVQQARTCCCHITFWSPLTPAKWHLNAVHFILLASMPQIHGNAIELSPAGVMPRWLATICENFNWSLVFICKSSENAMIQNQQNKKFKTMKATTCCNNVCFAYFTFLATTIFHLINLPMILFLICLHRPPKTTIEARCHIGK